VRRGHNGLLALVGEKLKEDSCGGAVVERLIGIMESPEMTPLEASLTREIEEMRREQERLIQERKELRERFELLKGMISGGSGKELRTEKAETE